MNQTEEKVREVAAELFATLGYSGASMSEIADRVGVRKASLYHHYGSKAELLLDLFDRALEEWTEASRPPLLGPGTFEERLFRHLEAAVAFVAARPHQVGVIRLAATQIGGDLGRQVMRRIEEHESQHHWRLRKFLGEAIEAGELRDTDPDDLLRFWRVFVDGLILNLAYGFHGHDKFDERLPQLWSLLWRGLGGRSADDEEATS